MTLLGLTSAKPLVLSCSFFPTNLLLNLIICFLCVSWPIFLESDFEGKESKLQSLWVTPSDLILSC